MSYPLHGFAWDVPLLGMSNRHIEKDLITKMCKSHPEAYGKYPGVLADSEVLSNFWLWKLH